MGTEMYQNHEARILKSVAQTGGRRLYPTATPPRGSWAIDIQIEGTEAPITFSYASKPAAVSGKSVLQMEFEGLQISPPYEPTSFAQEVSTAPVRTGRLKRAGKGESSAPVRKEPHNSEPARGTNMTQAVPKWIRTATQSPQDGTQQSSAGTPQNSRVCTRSFEPVLEELKQKLSNLGYLITGRGRDSLGYSKGGLSDGTAMICVDSNERAQIKITVMQSNSSNRAADLSIRDYISRSLRLDLAYCMGLERSLDGSTKIYTINFDAR